MKRLQVVLGHLSGRPEPGWALGLQAAPCSGSAPAAPSRAPADDIVVVHGRRTAIGKASRGGFKDTTPDELLAVVMTAVLRDVRLPPGELGDICVGNVLQPGAGAVMARIAQFLSDIPETVPLSAVNRQCSSGLQAVMNIAGGISQGSYDIGMACGVESMSLADRGNPGNITSRLVENSQARDCLIPMGITSENVAERFGISREKQDAFALASQKKAARAQSQGCFQAEIVPVTTTIQDNKGNEKSVTVSQDEGIRAGTTLEGLAKLKPAFKKDGSTTAGNSSQVSDGAAAILLARRARAEQLGLPILGILRAYAVVGVPPNIMGIGPAYAIPAALQKAGYLLCGEAGDSPGESESPRGSHRLGAPARMHRGPPGHHSPQ
ncbi:3-ketoacyl-CoA thiolase, peroxisomal isoform X2 [Vombatus ursinus]|uniref:3-ketoacyl-CoA thiolase, peroxisomal isoform X2 n=1 Tax=Vombatus ursinus TaxID=29139 RepID=UPI000FFD2560|nr:3-ketoacyl-CoA thiolase, peroxisomal isoform X2 [Vombatus ursinus]